MNQKQKVEFIDHRAIPEDIWVAVRAVDYPSYPLPGRKAESRKKEKEAGRLLIQDIVAAKLGKKSFHIESVENQKPSAAYNNKPVQISIAHTRGVICGAVSERKKVGIDLEPVQRNVKPHLRKRILHEEESEALRQITSLQLWTIKEAALKWLGSGLRTGMNTIHVVSARDPLFGIKFLHGQHAVVCSFEYRSHWISIAYDSS